MNIRAKVSTLLLLVLSFSTNLCQPVLSTSTNGEKDETKTRSPLSNRALTSKKEKNIYPDLISLGSIRPEGVVKGPKDIIYVSQTLFGGITRVNVRTGKVKQIVPQRTFGERATMGLAYYKKHIFAAGAGPAFGVPSAVYVFNAATGKEVAACKNETASFLFNDVTVRDGKAYITDSGYPSLVVLDAEKAIRGKCVVSYVPLPDEFARKSDTDSSKANGVVEYGDGLIVGNFGDGGATYINLMDNSAIKIIDTDLTSPDGLNVADGKLYVTQISLNQIGVYSLSVGKGGKKVTAVKEGTLTSPLYDSPSTSALYKGRIYSVNLKSNTYPFGSEATGEAEFDVASVRNVFGRDNQCDPE